MLDSRARKYVQPLFSSFAKVFIKFNVSPKMISVMALLLGLSSSILFYFNSVILAVIFLWLSGLLDALDGTVARMTGKASPLGAVIDILFDRIVEIAFILAVAFRLPETMLSCVLLLSSIIFSLTVFLSSGAIIARKSEKSFYYQAGIAERTETFIIFTLVMILPSMATHIFYLFTVMIIFTGLQRFWEVYLYLHKNY